MMRHSSNNGSSSWMNLKDQAKHLFEQGDYESALTAYGSALHPDLQCPAAERQVLLSNIVACRLKIGGPAQAEAAVETAKQCVALNDQWAKGHVRLASAYIALGAHSNDACNALQRAMQLDPGNPAARDMLIRELRRDQQQASRSSDSDSTSRPQPSAPPQEQDDREYNSNNSNSNDAPPPPTQNNNNYFDVDDHQNDVGFDDSTTWLDQLQLHYNRAKSWYCAQSEDKRTVLKVFLAVFIMYIAFGGRFGLEGTSGVQRRRGNYQSGNVYDQYHGRQGTKSSTTENSPPRYSSSSSDYYDHTSRQHTTRTSSFHFPNLFDGSIQSMMVLAGIAYVCYRNGIDPLQALFFLNMLGGGRRRRGMWGRGMHYGRGFGRPRRW